MMESFLNGLKKDVGVHDYDILFGGARTRSQTKIKRTGEESVQLKRMFDSISTDIEGEIIEEYCTLEDRNDNLDVTRNFVLATQVDLETRKKQNEEAELIARWSSHCQDSTVLQPDKLTQMMNLPDHIFECVISSTNMSIDVLRKVISGAIETPDVSEHQLGILAQYGLLPKICESNASSRAVFPTYKKLLEKTSSLTMLNRVLLPMFKRGAPISRPFYGNVDKELFFNLAINWMDEEHMELTPTLASILNHLIEDLKYVDDESHDIIVPLLERSVRYRPDDVDVSHFFWLVISKFGEIMSETSLKKLQSLNYANETKMKDRIHTTIEKQLRNFSAT